MLYSTFNRNLFSNNSTFFPYGIMTFIQPSGCHCILYFTQNFTKRNPCNIPITTTVRNTTWNSFNFDQVIFVFLIIIIICTKFLKHLIMYVMVHEKENTINQYIYHLLESRTSPLSQFYSTLQVA